MKIWLTILLAAGLCTAQPVQGDYLDNGPETAAFQEQMEMLRNQPIDGSAVRIRDLVKVVGEERVKLTGFGVVSGLNRTGDTGGAALKMLLNVAKKQNIRINPDDIGKKNLAIVSISAEVGPHERIFDIAVKSIGSAKSLQNGFLEGATLSPLGSSDVYAVGSGAIALGARHFEANGEEGADAGGSTSVTIGHPSSGYVLDGGELIKDIPSQRVENGVMELFVKYPNSRTSTNIANSINDYMAPIGLRAEPTNSSTIRIFLPKRLQHRQGDLTRLVADLGELPAKVSRRAIITIDQGSGVIAMTEGVKMSPGSIAVSGLTVTVASDVTPVSRQGAFNGETSYVGTPELELSEQDANFLMLPAGTDLRRVQETLNALRLKPTSIISVFTAMKQAGMIHADIVVLPR